MPNAGPTWCVQVASQEAAPQEAAPQEAAPQEAGPQEAGDAKAPSPTRKPRMRTHKPRQPSEKLHSRRVRTRGPGHVVKRGQCAVGGREGGAVLV